MRPSSYCLAAGDGRIPRACRRLAVAIASGSVGA